MKGQLDNMTPRPPLSSMDEADHSSRSQPIGAVDIFAGTAAPIQHESSSSWTDEAPDAAYQNTLDDEASEGSAGPDSNVEEEEESPGASLTRLNDTAFRS